MGDIYHITRREAWEQAQSDGVYRGDTLEAEGFIHCSERQQVVPVADAYFRGRGGLVLLCIDPARVRAEVRYEDDESGQLFPHIYGPLSVDAVTRVFDFEPGPGGWFELPDELIEI